MDTDVQMAAILLSGWRKCEEIDQLGCEYLIEGKDVCRYDAIIMANPYEKDRHLVEAVCREHLEFANTKRYPDGY